MFTLLKFGLVAEFETYRRLCEIRIPNKYKLAPKVEQAANKGGRKESESVRKPSDSTRKPSETSESVPSEKATKKEIEDKEKAAMSKIFCDLEVSAELQKAEIEALLDVKANADRYRNGFDWNSTLSQKFSELFKTFLREAGSASKCPRCTHLQPSIKKEGTSKFLLSGLSEKTKISKVLRSGERMKPELDKESSESEDNASAIDSEDKEGGNKRTGPKILHPVEIVEHMKTMWKENHKLLNIIFGKLVCNERTLSEPGPGYKMLKFSPHSFFISTLPVPPNRFRPENKTGGSSTYLHQHTVMLQKILSINFELKRAILHSKDKKDVFEIRETFGKWMELQDNVNGYFDSTKGGKTNTADAEPGIKQLLEKKEGIFRMKIMGKRVNYAARSVISPDPMLDTNEVGVPLFIAKKLTFPEAVNEANLDKLKTLIRNGPTHWPGAVSLVDGNKKISCGTDFWRIYYKLISLEGSTAEQREAIAKSLLAGAENKIVYRHLQHGDVLLFNRQPSLHKPSLMSHIARVLPKEHTIRMHYANCSSYNADFDGDEMNLHLLQNHLARAEAYTLSLSDKQYISATKNNPLRGLIQDIILSAVFLTMKGSFFEKSEYQQLIYTALRTHVDKDSNIKRIRMVPPCIMKPRKLWSGKQLID